MNDFQKKRLAYFRKAALNSDWVRLGPGDVELFLNKTPVTAEDVDKFMNENKELFDLLTEAKNK